MTIEPIYGKHKGKGIICDNCGAGFEADTWDADLNTRFITIENKGE